MAGTEISKSIKTLKEKPGSCFTSAEIVPLYEECEVLL
jgi:hypothetical protein